MDAGVLANLILAINMVTLAPLKSSIESLRMDMSAMRGEQKADNTALRTGLSAMRAEQKADNTALRTGLSAMRAEQKADITSLRTDLGAKLDRVLEKLDTMLSTKSAYLEGQMSILINQDYNDNR